MKIIEYNKKYDEDIKDLLVELEEYIVSIDEDQYGTPAGGCFVACRKI